MKAGVLLFPGTNCDRDLIEVAKKNFNMQVEILWHTETFEITHDIYFVPGGFSYGDYLRSGAMASMAASIQSLKIAAHSGRKILGICNGFQILTESGLLPGALIKNNTLKHICRWVKLEGAGGFLFDPNFRLPVSHSEGNFICDHDSLKKLEDADQVILRYAEKINGSVNDIAGIRNKNVFALMPHPERAMHQNWDWKESSRRFGADFFEQILAS